MPILAKYLDQKPVTWIHRHLAQQQGLGTKRAHEPVGGPVSLNASSSPPSATDETLGSGTPILTNLLTADGFLSSYFVACSSLRDASVVTF